MFLISVLATVLLAPPEPDFVYNFDGLVVGQPIVGQDGWEVLFDLWNNSAVATDTCSGSPAISWGQTVSTTSGARRPLETPLLYTCQDQQVVWRCRANADDLGGPPQNRNSTAYVGFLPNPSSAELVGWVVFGMTSLDNAGAPQRTRLRILPNVSLAGDVLAVDQCYEIELRVDFSQPGGVGTIAYRNVDENETEFIVDSTLVSIPLQLTSFTGTDCAYTAYYIGSRVDSGPGYRGYVDDLFLQAPVGSDPSECQPCATDLNCDGRTDIVDFLRLLGSWGPCVACLEDIDGDGVVSVVDFLALLAAWGPCR